ncbi:MAG: septal ring lytic transglycosylase RlpA family protein, partial [Alphaproteobacteria bacterium]
PACSPEVVDSGPSAKVKVGKPYVIMGKKYYPEFDNDYDKVGIASWYGPGFHGKYTANGEVFDQNDLTAAHPTLPMPSLVRVTNLHNGKSAIIRVNDRGPFKDNRIIDLSKKSAQRLGVTGLAKVRVKFLQQETQEYMAAIQNGQPFDLFAYNDRPPEAKIVESTRYSSYTTQDSNHAAPVMTVQASEPDPIRVVDQEPPAAEPEQAYAEPAYVASEPIPAQVPTDPPYEREPMQMAQAVPEPVAEAAISPSAGVASAGDFTIQAGVFSSEGNARKLVDRLSAIARASVETMESAGRTLWRVQVGSFETRSDAETLLASVRQQGNVPDARIVRR